MKKQELQKLREKTTAELQTELNQLSEKLAKTKLEKKVGRVSNVRSTGRMADAIARIKTIMREKELAAPKSAEPTEVTAQKVVTKKTTAKKETKKSKVQETTK